MTSGERDVNPSIRFTEEICVDSCIGINCSNYRIHKNQVVMILKFRPNFRWFKNHLVP